MSAPFSSGDIVRSDLYPDARGVVVDGRETPDGRVLVSGVTPGGLSAYLLVSDLGVGSEGDR